MLEKATKNCKRYIIFYQICVPDGGPTKLPGALPGFQDQLQLVSKATENVSRTAQVEKKICPET